MNITWSKLTKQEFGEDIESRAEIDGEYVGHVEAYRYCKPADRTYDTFCNGCQEKFMERGDLKMAREFLKEHLETCNQ